VTARAAAEAAGGNGNGAGPSRSDTRTDAPIPTPPFLGPRVLREITVDDVYDCIDRNSLYKMSWQFRSPRYRDKEVWAQEVRETLEPRLALSMDEARRDGYLQIQAVYGYWPALAEGDSIVVFDPDDRERVIGRLSFPRQDAQSRLCLADYVRPREQAKPGERDVIALQVVTAGPEASERSNALQRDGQYDDMLRVHGFSTQIAEATAEWLHRRINTELGIPQEQGRRYSWGYPACPELEDHKVVFSILPAPEIGVSLTEAFQMMPEQSTAAIVLHHPQARYFAVYTAASAPPDEELVGAGTPEV
jgi:5-methyltetrahydrofolate--homocysteine methyltransferase